MKRFFDAWQRSVPPAPPRETGRARFLEAIAEPRRAPRRTLTAAVALMAAAASIALFVWWRTPPALHFTTAAGEGAAGAWLATNHDELDLAFSEGTHVVLAADSRGRVEELGRSGASFVLERGEFHAVVAHRRADTNWRFRAGPFEVQVTGTRLDVGWDPEREKLTVRVDEGAVVVRGGSAMAQVVRAGERYVVDLPTRTARFATEEPVDAGPPEEDAVVDAAPPSPSSSAAPPPRALPSWTRLAARGDYDGAYAAAAATGIASVLRASTADELLRFAQVSQLSGHRDTERDALLTCRRRFPATEPAAVAAYELGRGAPPAEAGRWFEAYLAEQPNGPLAREAAGRALESKVSAGDRDGARAAASQYLARYPNGPHAAMAQQIVSSSP